MTKNSFVVEVTFKTNYKDFIFYVYNPTTADFSKESPLMQFIFKKCTEGVLFCIDLSYIWK